MNANIACAVDHRDADGNPTPCPGYPHAEQTTTTPLDLAAIRARVDAATEGPWEMWADRTVRAANREILYDDSCQEAENGDADAEFIAHARTDIPALLAEIERLTDAEYPRTLRRIWQQAEADFTKAHRDLTDLRAKVTALAGRHHSCGVVCSLVDDLRALACSTCGSTGLVDWAPGQIRDTEGDQQPCPDCRALLDPSAKEGE